MATKGKQLIEYDESNDPELMAYEASMDFSDQVVAKCKELGISFTELAEKTGVSPSTLSEKLNGQNLTLKSMAKIAIALGCTLKAPGIIEKETCQETYSIQANSNPTEMVWEGYAIPYPSMKTCKMSSKGAGSTNSIRFQVENEAA